MKTKLLFTKQNSNALYILLVFCLCFNLSWSQTNLVLNGTGDLFTVTQDDADNNTGWVRNDSDNADAFDMSPSSTVIYDAEAMSTGATTTSPYRALWNNGDLDTWLKDNCGDDSEIPGSSSDGNFDYSAGPTMGVQTRGVKLSESCRRLYQKVAVTSGISYTLFLESRSEAQWDNGGTLENVTSEVYILNTEIADEVGIDANGAADATVDDFMEITNDFNSSKSNATTNNFTKNSLEFTPTGSFVVIYVRAPNASTSSLEVFYDNIELYETSTLSVDDVFASNFKVYPNPAQDYIQIESRDVQVSSVEMYNLVGKKLISETNLVDSKLNISSLSTGVYLLKVNAEGRSLNKRIVVE